MVLWRKFLPKVPVGNGIARPQLSLSQTVAGAEALQKSVNQLLANLTSPPLYQVGNQQNMQNNLT